MNRLAAMEAFVRVIDIGSFSTAARQLRVGQPAISKAIANLEERLGMRLLLRSTHGLTLKTGKVTTVLRDWSLPDVDLWAVFPTGRRASAKARAFVGFMASRLSKDDAGIVEAAELP